MRISDWSSDVCSSDLQACRRLGRELMIEIIAGKHGSLGDDAVARVLATFYRLGIKPDWWKLEPQPGAAAWQAIDRAIAEHDPLCRGVVLLGLEAPEAQLAADFAAAQSRDRKSTRLNSSH